MAFMNRLSRMLRIPIPTLRRSRRSVPDSNSTRSSIHSISPVMDSGSELKEDDRFPKRVNIDIFNTYLELPPPKAFVKRVFQGDSSGIERDYSGYSMIQKMLYIQEMMMCGILYIWYKDVTVTNKQFISENKVHDPRKMEEDVNMFFTHITTEACNTPEKFILFFHNFLHFYKSIRSQTKESIFKSYIDNGFPNSISVKEKWVYCMDLFWMYCLYTYPSKKDTFSVIEWIHGLYREPAFLILLFLNIIVYYQYHGYDIGDDGYELYTYERTLVHLVQEQSGFTGFESKRPKLSSLETRVKRRFSKETESDRFTIDFIGDLLIEFKNAITEHSVVVSPFKEYANKVRSSPSLQQSSPRYFEDIVEKSLHPDRVGQTGLMETVQYEPVSEEELSQYGLGTGKYGDVYSKTDGTRRARPISPSIRNSPSLSRSYV